MLATAFTSKLSLDRLPASATVVSFLIAVLIGVLGTQHALNAKLDWSDVTYVYGDEILAAPPKPDDIAKLLQRDNSEVIGFRAHSNGAIVRRSIVQFVAHHQGAVVRYGYVHKAGEQPRNPLVLFTHEIGFSNKYDEPLVVQLPPDAAALLVERARTTKGRTGMQRWVAELPQTVERPVVYSPGLPREWPVVKIRVEPSTPTVEMVMGTILLGMLLSILAGVMWWPRPQS